LPELIAWFDTQRRSGFPTRVSLVRDASHVMPLSWSRIDATEQIAEFSENLVDKRDRLIAAAIYAKLHAEILKPNTIAVRAIRVKQYTLFLNKALVDFSKPIVVKTNGIQSFEGMVEPSIKMMLQEARQRRDRNNLYPARLTINLVPAQ